MCQVIPFFHAKATSIFLFNTEQSHRLQVDMRTIVYHATGPTIVFFIFS